MKKFNYFNMEVTVPDCAKFIATDEDGECYWYTNKPIVIWSTWVMNGGDCGMCSVNHNIKNWRRSLREC